MASDGERAALNDLDNALSRSAGRRLRVTPWGSSFRLRCADALVKAAIWAAIVVWIVVQYAHIKAVQARPHQPPPSPAAPPDLPPLPPALPLPPKHPPAPPMAPPTVPPPLPHSPPPRAPPNTG